MSLYNRWMRRFGAIFVTLACACVASTDTTTTVVRQATITVAPSVVPADGLTQATVTVDLGNIDGATAAHVPITLKSDLAGVVFSDVGTTNAQGIAQATVTSTGVGTASIRAQVTLGNTQTTLDAVGMVRFMQPILPAATHLALTTHNDNAVADGQQTISLTLTATDQNGQPLIGQAVYEKSTQQGDVLTPTYVTTDALGMATFTVQSEVAGARVITVSLKDGVATSQITFVPGSLSDGTSRMLLNITSLVGDGVAGSTGTMTATDAFGNAISNLTVALTSSDSNDVITPAIGRTDASGALVFTVRSEFVGVKTITATINGVVFHATITITPPVPDNTKSSFVVSPLSVQADGTSSATLTITVREISNLPLDNIPVSLTATGTANVFGVTSGTTNAQGVFFTTLKSTHAEVKSLVATLPGTSLQAQATFVPGQPTPVNTAVTLTPGTVAADGIATTSVVLTAKDNFGNATPNIAVALAVSGTNNTLGAASGHTDASGIFATTLKSTHAETKVVTATLPSTTVTGSVVFTADANHITATLVANPNVVVADGSSATTLTTTVVDTYGNPVSGEAITLATTGTNNTFGNASGTTNASGQYTTTLVATSAGTKVVTATVAATQAQTTVVFQAGSAASAQSTFVASPNNVLANGSAQSTVTLTARDAYNNLVANQAVSLSVSGTNNSVGSVSGTTNASGVWSTTVASTKAETKTALASFGAASRSTSIVFAAGALNTANSSFTASPTPVTADGTSQTTLTLVARDAQNNLLTNTAVSISSTGTNNTFSPMSGTTDSSGQFVTTLKSTKAENKTVSAAVAGSSISVVVPFVAGSVDGAQTTLVASPSALTADGTHLSTLTLTVRDASGNVVANQGVTLTSSGTGDTLTQTTSTTNASGVLTATLASTTAQAADTVTASFTGVSGVTVTTNVQFLAGAPSLANCSLVANPNSVVDDGVTQSNLVLTVRDVNNNPVNNATINWSATGSNNTLGAVSATTNSAGQTQVSLASTTAETKTVTATVAAGSFSLQTAVFFTVGAASNAKSSFVASPTSVVANNAAQSTLTLTVRDAQNNPISNQAVTLSTSGPGSATLGALTGTTDASGVLTTTIKNATSGVQTITASYGGATSTVAVTFTAGTPTTLSSISASPSTVTADGASTTSLTIVARDAQNNVVPSQTVALTATGTGQAFGQASVTTDATGTATTTLTSTVAGTKTITATLPGGAQVTTTVTFVAGTANASQSTFTASPNSQIADGTSTMALLVTARDAHGNLITGQSVSLSSPQASDAFGTPSGATDGTGTFSSTISGSVSGQRTLTAALGSVNVTVVVTFTAGTPSTANSVVTASPSSLTADGSSQATLTYTVRDANNNLVPGAPVTFTSTGTGQTFAQASGTTNASGVYTTTMTSTKAEVKTITAASGSNSSNTTTVTFVVGAAQATTSSFTAAPSSQTAGTSTIALTVTVRDTQNNPISGLTVTLSGGGTSNTFTQASGSTNSSGVYTTTLSSTKAQTETITASFGGTNKQLSVTFTPNVAASPNTTITSNINQVTADGNSTAVLTITAKDAYGNLIANQAVSLTATGSNNNFQQGTGTTNASGVFQATLASTTAESKTITATVGAATATVVVNFVAGTPQSLTFTSNANVVVADGASASTLTLSLRDSSNNAVSGTSATFSSSDANDTLSTTSGTTDTNGLISLTIKATIAEVKTITASVGGVQVTTTVTFVAGNPNSALSSLVASPNTVTADGSSSTTLTWTARDAFGNPVQNANVALTSTGTGYTFGQASGQTAADGTYATTLVSSVAGSNTVTATNTTATSTTTVAFVAGAASQSLSTLALSPNTVTADGASNSNVLVTARDAQGNLIQNQTVSLALSGTNYTFSPASGTTDVNGQFPATLKSTKAQANVTVTATLGGASLTKSITFVAGPPYQANCVVTASPNSVMADGSSVSNLSLLVADAQGNPVPNIAATLATSGTGNTLTGASGTTDATGTITGTLASTVAETKTITAGVTASSFSVTTTATFTAGAVSSTYSTLTASPNNVTADGVQTTTITVTARDAQNNLITGQAVSLTSTGLNNTFGSATGTTNGSGVYTTTLKSTTAQTKSLTAALGGSASATGSVTFVPGAPSTSTSTFVASPNNVTADGTSTTTLTLTLRDAQSNLIASSAANFTSSGTNNTFGTASGSTNPSGVLSSSLASTTAETKSLVAHFTGGTLPATVTFVAGAATTANSTLVASPNQVVANNSASTTLTLTLRDAQNNLVSNNTATFTSTGSNYTFGTPSSATSAGVATTTMVSSKAESKTVTATFTGGSLNVVVVFVAGPPAVTYSTFIANPNQVSTDSTSTSTLTHTVRDAQNNPVGSQTVALTASGTSNVYSPSATGSTNASTGVFSASLSSTLAQSEVITSSASPIAQTANVTFLVGAANSSTSTLVASPNQVVANNSNTTTLVVTVRDAQNNPINNQNVTFTSTGTGNTFSALTGYTNSSGQLTVTLASSVAQSKTITASFGAAQTTATVVFIAGPPSSANSTLVASPTSLTADGTTTTTLTLTARDANNNLIAATTVNYTANGSANTFSPASNTTSSGVSTTTLASTLAQTETITATFGGATATATVTFVAGAPASAQSSITASPNSLTADNTATSTLLVTVKDSKGNVVANANVVLSASGANNTFGSLTGITNASGQFTTTLKSTKAQSESISAALGNGSTPPSVSTPVVFVAGASSNVTSNLATNPNSNTADGTSAITLTVTALDVYSNPLNGAAVTLSGNGSNNTFANASGTTNSSGVYSTTITSTTAQTENITANITP